MSTVIHDRFKRLVGTGDLLPKRGILYLTSHKGQIKDLAIKR